MSDPLIELLRANPNCRVTIITGKTRKQPHSGDIKIVRGKRLVRQQVMTRDGYHVHGNGKPVWEWVREEDKR